MKAIICSVLSVGLGFLAVPGLAAERMPLIVNEPAEHFFVATRRPLARETKGKIDAFANLWDFRLPKDVDPSEHGVEGYVDALAGGNLTHLFINVNYQRSFYPSKVIEPIWTSLEESDCQKPPSYIRDLKAAFDHGLDVYAVMVRRSREKGVSPWLSFRMNDIHGVQKSYDPGVSTFWKEHPEWHISKDDGWSNGLDYAEKAVRDRMVAYIREALERYDVDGIGLDLLRFPFYFRKGKERENAPFLTAFLREVRAVCNAAAKRRGHPVKIAARFLPQPERAAEMGADVGVWAHEGLLDMAVVCNMYDSIEYEYCLADWRKLLGVKVQLIAGTDNGIVENKRRRILNLGEYRDWIAKMRRDGADGIYFFNFPLRPYRDEAWRGILGEGLMSKVEGADDNSSLDLDPSTLDSSWRAGFARVDLEPPKGLSLAGYFEDRPCTGVKDPVEATCVALGTAEGTALLYTLDLVELKGVAPEWKKAIAAATGLKPETVVLACTHTHTAPSVGPAAASYEISVEGTREYDAVVLEKLIAAGKAALADLAPAEMRQATTEAKGLSFVRRYRMKDGTVRTNPGAGRLADVVAPAGEPDESVQIVRLDRGPDRPAIALVNFQCHADMIGGTAASADWPGFARRALERDLGVKAAVFNGAAGDTNHLNLRDFRHGYDACRAFGEKLAASVRAAWNGAVAVAPEPLAATFRPVEVTLLKPSRAERAATNALSRVARNRVAKLADAPLRLQIPVTHLRFGDAFALCGYPCEPFTEIGRDTKRRVSARMTFVTSLTDGSYGYLPTADAYDAGAYETDSAIFVPGTDRLMTMAAALAGRLPPGLPKVVKVKGIPNMRDLGGWTGLDGRRVRTGRIFRSAGLNNNATSKVVTNDVGAVVTNFIAGACRLDAEGRFAVTNTLGIRTDLDLRRPDEIWGMTGSPAGANVVWTNFSSGSYGNILTDWGRKAFAEEFLIFLDERNYPIDFHCIAGADRTGTLAYVLNALLGVAEDDLDADYAFTASTWKVSQRQGFLGPLFPKLKRTFDGFPGKTVHERVASFVKAQGFTDADIAHFRELMLEK